MTHPDYRKRGLSASLMNMVLDEYENKYDFLYLFANQLAIIVLIPVLVGGLIYWILQSIKLPKSIANFIAVIIIFFVFYKIIPLVFG